MNNKTIEYYNKNAIEYVQSTANLDFHEIQDRFLSYLKKGDSILDFGCGSGRDTRYFLDCGFQVDATDGSEELCKLASELIGFLPRNILFSELDEIDKFHGIWACASILHVPKLELVDVFSRMIRALHKNGIIYTSFKYGDSERKQNTRFFTDFNEKMMRLFLEQFPELSLKEMWITADVRSEQREQKWLNLILQKSNVI